MRVTYQGQALERWAAGNPAAAKRVVRRVLIRGATLGVRVMRQVARERFGRIGVRHPGLGPPVGELAASIRAEAPTHTHVDVGPNVPHAIPVNDGSRPHLIRATRARSLRWVSKISFAGKLSRGNVHFAKVVRHPGFQGHRYLERTVVRLRPLLEREAAAAIEWEVTHRP